MVAYTPAGTWHPPSWVPKSVNIERNISLRCCRDPKSTKLDAKIVENHSWKVSGGVPGRVLGSSGEVLGGVWEVLGEFWGVLGGVWEVLGEFWGGLGRRLGGLGEFWGGLGRFLGWS